MTSSMFIKHRISIASMLILLISMSVSFGQEPEVDLRIHVESASTVIPVNMNFIYSILVENLGGDDATFVTVTDSLPDEVVFLSSDDGCTVSDRVILCEIEELAANTSTTVTYQVRAIEESSEVRNSARVTGAEIDPTPENNSASYAIEIVMPEPVDLALSGSVSPTQFVKASIYSSAVLETSLS